MIINSFSLLISFLVVKAVNLHFIIINFLLFYFMFFSFCPTGKGFIIPVRVWYVHHHLPALEAIGNKG